MKMIVENKSEMGSNHLKDKYEQKHFSPNDNRSNSMFQSTSKQRIKTQKYYEGDKQNIVSTLAGKSSKCGKRHKQFASYHGLNFHNKSVHEGAQYSCHKCKYKATTKPNLYIHVKPIHEGIRYPCDQYDYNATQTRYLYRHQSKYHN